MNVFYETNNGHVYPAVVQPEYMCDDTAFFVNIQFNNSTVMVNANKLIFDLNDCEDGQSFDNNNKFVAIWKTMYRQRQILIPVNYQSTVYQMQRNYTYQEAKILNISNNSQKVELDLGNNVTVQDSLHFISETNKQGKYCMLCLSFKCE